MGSRSYVRVNGHPYVPHKTSLIISNSNNITAFLWQCNWRIRNMWHWWKKPKLKEWQAQEKTATINHFMLLYVALAARTARNLNTQKHHAKKAPLKVSLMMTIMFPLGKKRRKEVRMCLCWDMPPPHEDHCSAATEYRKILILIFDFRNNLRSSVVFHFTYPNLYHLNFWF